MPLATSRYVSPSRRRVSSAMEPTAATFPRRSQVTWEQPSLVDAAGQPVAVAVATKSWLRGQAIILHQKNLHIFCSPRRTRRWLPTTPPIDRCCGRGSAFTRTLTYMHAYANENATIPLLPASRQTGSVVNWTMKERVAAGAGPRGVDQASASP